MSKKKQFNNVKEQNKGLQPLVKLKIILAIIIGCFAFLLYAQSIGYDYADDAVGIIKENKTVQKGLSAVPYLMKNDSWDGSLWDIRGSYRPTSVIMFAIEWHFFPDNPNANHFINVLLYAITCSLLFLLLIKLFKNKNLIFPFICVLLYAAHPLHTEVVANIKSRDEILCFLFAIISIFFFLKYYTNSNNTGLQPRVKLSNNSTISLLLGGFFYFLSFASKETAISFMIIIPLLIYFFNTTNIKRLTIISVVLIISSIIFLSIRYKVLDILQSEQAIKHMNLTFYLAHDFISRQATAFYILLRYIFLLIFPHPLSFDYSFNQIKIQTLSNLPAIAGIIIYIVITIYAIINIKKKSVVAFAILLYLIALSPVANVFMVIGSTMAERFMYIPSLGFCMIVAYFLIKLTKTDNIIKTSNISDFIKTYSLALIITFVIITAYSVKTFSRTKDWKDDATLFGHDVNIATNSARAHYQWARSLSRYQYPMEKDKDKQMQLLDEAIKHYKLALDIDVDYYGYRLLADCYHYKGDMENAIKYYETAMNFNNPDRITFYNELGYLYLNTKQLDKAQNILDSAIKYYPNFNLPYFNKGIVLYKKGNYPESISALLKAIELEPKYEQAYIETGVAYGLNKQYTQALEYFNKALELNPDNIHTHEFIGTTYQLMGNAKTAKTYFDKVNAMRNSNK